MPIQDIFEAAKEAGRQLVEIGEMSSQTVRIIGRELVPIEKYLKGEFPMLQSPFILDRKRALLHAFDS